jgi:hypothetical protein
VAPLLLFGPRRAAIVAGLAIAAFQGMLILSGNLSWLNWLTLTLCVACLDDRALARVLPRRLVERARALADQEPSGVARAVAWGLVVVVGALSVAPTVNLLSSEQVMNGSFDRLHLVNTYGAFGSVGRARNEVVIEGTLDETPDEGARWREYQLPCKPGDPARRPCVIAPYQPRLDWQIWFAAMSSYAEEPWLVHLAAKLLRNDPGALSLLDGNPFPDRPPRWIRAGLYEYRFTRWGERGAGWWTRRYLGPYLPAISADDSSLAEFLRGYGWED